ncbi:MAG: Ig-like domain-containing protein [Steroidobacteraceae bacterium]
MLLALLTVAGCQSPQAEPATAASGMAVVVSVRPERVVLTPGDSAQLQCQASDVDGGAVGGAEFTFESEDPAIANVDRFGRIAAAGPAGDTSIVVRSGTLRARVPVRVEHGEPVDLQPVSGDAQQIVAGAAADEPWVVRVRDVAGNPVAGIALTLRIDGAADAAQTTTDADGEAHWTPVLPTTAGPVRMLVEPATPDAEQPLVLRLSAQVLPAAVATLGVDDSVTRDDAADARRWRGGIIALDRFGNRTPQVPIEWQVAPACGRLVESITTTTDAGTAAVTIENARKPPRGCRVVARAADGIETSVPLR